MKENYNNISAMIDKGQEVPNSPKTFLKGFFDLLAFTSICFGIGICFGICFEETVKWIIGY